MLFRDFNMIAAVAYAAERAAHANSTPLWDELDDDERMKHTQRVMALARGETPPATSEFASGEAALSTIFGTVAKAILDYNGGQGLLALEDLMNLGSTVMSLELLTEAEVADTNIRESIVTLLHELAERRQGAELGLGATAMGINGDSLRGNPRFEALDYAAQLDGSVETAEVFARFLTDGEGRVCNEASSMLDIAMNVVRNRDVLATGPLLAERAVNLAASYHAYINQAAPIADNVPDEAAEPQVVAVH